MKSLHHSVYVCHHYKSLSLFSSSPSCHPPHTHIISPHLPHWLACSLSLSLSLSCILLFFFFPSVSLSLLSLPPPLFSCSQEDDSSSMNSSPRGLPPLPNSDRYNLIRHRLDRYRRGSEGNFTSPTEIILRIPRLPGSLASKMERGRHSRPHALKEEHSSASRTRSISPNESGGRPRSSSLDVDDTPLSVSRVYNPDEIDSGSST